MRQYHPAPPYLIHASVAQGNESQHHPAPPLLSLLTGEELHLKEITRYSGLDRVNQSYWVTSNFDLRTSVPRFQTKGESYLQCGNNPHSDTEARILRLVFSGAVVVTTGRAGLQWPCLLYRPLFAYGLICL